MSALRDRTFFPPAGRQTLSELDDFVSAHDTAELRSHDGRVMSIPAEVYEVLRDVVAALRMGQAITVAPHHTELTTQEAADLLGISRPTLIKRLDRDELPYTRPGRHRRLRLLDVLTYRQALRDRRRKGIDELARLSEAADLYELDPGDLEAAERRLRSG